jgi:hypothetical protein
MPRPNPPQLIHEAGIKASEEVMERLRLTSCKISAILKAENAALRIQTISRAMSRPVFPPNRMIREGSIRDAISSANSLKGHGSGE